LAPILAPTAWLSLHHRSIWLLLNMGLERPPPLPGRGKLTDRQKSTCSPRHAAAGQKYLWSNDASVYLMTLSVAQYGANICCSLRATFGGPSVTACAAKNLMGGSFSERRLR
jgi:hypothetical protein